MWLIAFDVDGTLLERPRSSWALLHEVLGTENKAKLHREWFRKGLITYHEWARLDASLWKGLKVDEILHKIRDKVKLREGAKELLEKLRSYDVKIALLSSGVDLVLRHALDNLEVDYLVCNSLASRNGVLTGEVIVRVDFYGKGRILKKLRSQLGVPKHRVIAIGDEVNDIAMFEEAAFSIAYNPSSKEVVSKARYVIISPKLNVLEDLIFSLIS